VGVLAAELGNRIDHLFLLVHLDREDSAVLPAVADLFDDAAEGVVEEPYLAS
jgi:hypothetical protein